MVQAGQKCAFHMIQSGFIQRVFCGPWGKNGHGKRLYPHRRFT